MDFLSATEWLQRHAVHLLLRHGLSHFFASPVDLEQLKTQWGRSAASQSLSWFGKLSDLQLNARYLSQFTKSLGAEVTAATAGTLEIVVSFSGPSLTLRLSDVHLHVQLAETACQTEGSNEQSAECSIGDATVPPTVASRLRDQLKHVSSAVERMLNTVSCRVDGISVHCTVPPMPEANDTDEQAKESISSIDGDSAVEVVISADCVKMVDTSDCFLAPACVTGKADDGNGTARPIEVTKSFFWDGLRVELVTSESNSDQPCSSPTRAQSSNQQQEQRSRAKSVHNRSTQRCETVSESTGSHESVQQAAGHSSGDESDDYYELEDSNDAENEASRSPIVLFGGLQGSGWDGKATLELVWAAAGSNEASALQRVSIGVEGRGPAAVALHAKQVPHVAHAVARVHAAVAEQQAHTKDSTTPVVGLQDLTMSMFDALRPEDGLQDVLAVSAVDGDLMNSAVTAQEAGPRYLSGATPSDSPRANVSSDATAPGPTYSLQPTTCIQKVIWDIQVSSAPGTSAAGESLPAISVSLWDAQAVDASASANGLHGISLEAKDVSLKLRNSPEKPQRFECTASGLRIVELLEGFLHSVQGGNSRLKTCLRIPQLLDVAPTSPAPSACVSMDPSETQDRSPVVGARPVPAALTQFTAQSPPQQHGSSVVGIPEVFVWPVLAPVALSHSATVLQTEHAATAASSDAPWSSKLTMPAYMAVVTPSLLKRLASMAALNAKVSGMFASAYLRRSEPEQGPWNSMFAVPSQSQTHIEHDLNFSLSVPRIFCVLLSDSQPFEQPNKHKKQPEDTDEEQQQQPQHTHLVLDVRCARSSGRTSQREQLLQAAFSHRRNRPLHADIQASSVSAAIVSELQDGCMSAQCVAGMAPGKSRPSSANSASMGSSSRPSSASSPSSESSVPAALRLSVSMQWNTKSAARCAVIGDPVAMAWAQAEAHRCRDWQLGTGGPKRSHAGASTIHTVPASGLLFPVTFSAAEVDKVAHAGSDVATCIRVPALAVHTSEQQLKTVTNMLGSLIACTRVTPTQQHLPPSTRTMHIAVKGVVSGRVVIDGQDGTQEIDMSRAALVLGQGLGGVAGAMVAHVVVTGVRIIHCSTASSAPAQLLLHVPTGNGSAARLETLVTSCPLEQQQQCGPLKTRTLTSHHIKSATFGTLAGDLSLPWLGNLSSLFQLPAPTTESPVAVSEASTHLSLEDCAVAYMPPSSPVVGPNCTAFVVYARGVHTYTSGSARHVDITAANIALGRVRSGGVAPWACEQPAAGWSEQTCASLGLEALATGDAISVLLDSSATVDSEALDEPVHSTNAAQESQAPEDENSGVTLHGLAELDALSGGVIDPLLLQVRRRQAAEAQLLQASQPKPEQDVLSCAQASGMQTSGDTPQGPCNGIHNQQHRSTSNDGATTATGLACRESYRQCASTCCGGVGCDGGLSPEGSGHSRGDSDMEVLSGQDARMMAVLQVHLQQLLVSLTPDTCILVSQLSTQLSEQYGSKTSSSQGQNDAKNDPACPANNKETCSDLPEEHAAVRIAGTSTDADTAPCSSIEPRAPAEQPRAALAFSPSAQPSIPPSSMLEGTFNSISGCSAQQEAMDQATDHTITRGNMSHTPPAPSAREGMEPAVSDSIPPYIAQNMSVSAHQSCTDRRNSSDQANDHSPQHSGMLGRHMHASTVFGRTSIATFHSLDHSHMPLSQTIFQDASSMINPRDSFHSVYADPANGASTSESAYHSAILNHSTVSNVTSSNRTRYPRIAPLPNAPNFMHDMDLAGESVIAVGTMAESQLHAAGVPSEQEEDGLVVPELQRIPDGLLGSVVEDYVGTRQPAKASNAAEPVLGRLGGNYPDSCRRLSVSAGCMSVLLRPDGIMSSDYASAAAMTGKGLVKLEVKGTRLQHDSFSEGRNKSRLAARVRSIEVQQSGFISNRAQRAAQTAGQGGIKWRPLAAHLKQGPSDPRHDVFKVLLQVQATAAGSKEASVTLRLPSLRLHLEQLVFVFLKDFAAAFEKQKAKSGAAPASTNPSGLGDSYSDSEALCAGQSTDCEEAEEALAASADSCTLLVSFAEPVNANPSLMNTVFKSVEVGWFTLAVDYTPSATDYTALREGSLFELVNLVCWNNVKIDFKAASLQNVHGLQALMRLLVGRWVADIRSNQAVRVLEGATPVASFVRLGSAVHRLASHAATLPVNSQVTTQLEWQETVLARRLLHRSARHLLHTLTLEALGLGAWVAGSTAGILGVEVQAERTGALAAKNNMLLESADLIRREVGTSLAALFTAPQAAINQGQGVHGAALAAAKAMPNAIIKPLGATAAAVQKTCVGMQHAVENK